ncbi:MAG: hypothetical protein U0P30_03280 [Vicinamibacterales bacterium]
MTLRATLAALAFLAPLTATAPALAQPAAPADARWSPWIGCWKSVDDTAGTGARVCVTPKDGCVAVVTVVGGQRLSDELRVADGRDRAVETGGCTGTASVRWAPAGTRVYRTAAVACDGGPTRTLTSVAFFADGPTWVDVETVRDGDDTRVRVTRLVKAPSITLADGTAFPRAAGAITAAALARWTVDDVIELSAALPPDGVQAAISEAPGPFALNKRSLVALADAGVGDRVIDLMVGVTYPSKFVVQRSGPVANPMGPIGVSLADPFFSPIVGPAALFNCYQPFAWAATGYWGNCASFDPYYYSRYPGYYSGYWGAYGSDWIVTSSNGIGTGTVVGTPTESRLVNGRGYTQVRPVDTTYGSADQIAASGGSSNGAQSTGSSGGSVSSGGYSGGGSGAISGGGDRTAVPRGPGGR